MTFIGAALLWGFFGVLVLVLAAAALILVVLPSVLLRASCSVAEVKEPGYLLSFPLGYGVVLYSIALAAVGGRLLAGFETDLHDLLGPMHLCGYAGGLVLAWVTVSLVYRIRAFITPSVLKGFWVAGMQTVLFALYFALMAGLAFTALSVWQLLGYAPPWSNASPKPTAVQVAPAAVDRS